jgi:hypothetical protein
MPPVSPSARQVAAAQAAYYLPTAVLPFVSRRAFESVTGRKLELVARPDRRLARRDDRGVARGRGDP